MYLQQFRDEKVSRANWPGGELTREKLSICFDIADATLNSWVEAHTIFKRRRRDHPDPAWIDYPTYKGFIDLIMLVFRECEDEDIKRFARSVFASHCLAYAVLVEWIKNEAAETKCAHSSQS